MASFSDINWIEWQANEFMLCLLFPYHELMVLLARVQARLGMRVGPIFVDKQLCNQASAARVIAEMSLETMIQLPLIKRRHELFGFIKDVRSTAEERACRERGTWPKEMFDRWSRAETLQACA